MLMVDPAKRFTIDQCLAHPWLTQTAPSVNDSTGGLVGGIAGLDFQRRAPVRERTLLASINTVTVQTQPPANADGTPVKVYAKNAGRVTNIAKEVGPAHHRAPEEFVGMGGKGDQQLYADDNSSVYAQGGKPKSKDKAKHGK